MPTYFETTSHQTVRAKDYDEQSLRQTSSEDSVDFGGRHDRGLKLQVGLSVGRSRSMPGGKKVGASVTRIIKASDKNVSSQSTVVMSPEGQQVLGKITIGGVNKMDSNRMDEGQRDILLEREMADQETNEGWWWCQII